MLDDLDQIEWAGLTHAYDSPEDVPYLLRDLASADPEKAERALDNIGVSLFHQGTVYESTVPAVPFLVELAQTAPYQQAGIVDLLGGFLDPEVSHGEPIDQVRAGVLAHARQLSRLLSDPDPEVRCAAAYLVAHCGEAAPAAVLWRSWAEETSPDVRGSLLLALHRRDPAGCHGLLASALTDDHYPVRVAAALVMLQDGADLPAGAVAPLAEAFAAGVKVRAGWRRDSTLDKLLNQVNDEWAAGLLGRLLDASEPEVRKAAVWAVSGRIRTTSRDQPPRRSPARLLVPLLGPALTDPAGMVREPAIYALSCAGAASGRFAAELARVAAGYPQAAVVRRDSLGQQTEQGYVERRALETLALLGDPRWVDPVCAAWTAGREVKAPWQLRHHPAVLQAVRERLGELARNGVGHPLRALAAAELARVLRLWEPAALAAEPELRAALPLAPQPVLHALLTVGAAVPSDAPLLAALAVAGVADVPELTRTVDAGIGVWRLTGDGAPLLALLEQCLAVLRPVPPGRPQPRGGLSIANEVARAADAGAPFGPLIPELRRYLTGRLGRSPAERVTQAAAATAVWQATGELSQVMPTVVALLRPECEAAGLAASLVARLPNQSPELLMRPLRACLRDRQACVAAARALFRLGVPTTDLVPAIITSIEYRYGTEWATAIGLLVEIGATEAVPELRRLADREERVLWDTWEDEQLQDELRTAIAALERTA